MRIVIVGLLPGTLMVTSSAIVGTWLVDQLLRLSQFTPSPPPSHEIAAN